MRVKATVVTKDVEREMPRKESMKCDIFFKRKQAESQNMMSNWSEGLLKKITVYDDKLIFKFKPA
ncbi:MAG: hypothetical protein ACLR43_03725 [Faecalibacillus faecis]